MKLYLNVILLILVTGCTSNVAQLHTDKPSDNQYWFVFGRALLDYDEAKSLKFAERISNYEEQLNKILAHDKNTNSCSIVPSSINFGEPGSQGTANVHCQEPVSVQVREGIFNREGFPTYSYTLSPN